MAASFENLDVWKAGCRLAVQVTRIMGQCQIYGLRDQMIRSAISIPSNIAEGSERRTPNDFRYFIHVALGSAAELRTQTYIAMETDSIPKETGNQWITELNQFPGCCSRLPAHLSEIRRRNNGWFTVDG
jgi:four helix bundle protein